MKIWILVFATLAVGYAQQCAPCRTMKWATCDGNSCPCFVWVNEGLDGKRKQNIDCTQLVPKCYLMQAEMYRAKRNMSTRSIGDKPHETAFVDNDGIYDPVCENDGKFRAKQCNNTKECWCVNSAGVRRTDKGDESLKCDELVETYWVSLRLKHKPLSSGVTLDKNQLKTAIGDAIKSRYNFNSSLVKEIQYDPDARLIVVDVMKPIGDRTTHLDRMAYYMEKDVKILPLFLDQAKFSPSVGSTQLDMEDILVYYVDEKAPTFTMKNLSGGIVAVIVVVVLLVVAGLVILLVLKKRREKYNKAQQNDQ
ncbi:epithelial cell adhesion molecule [Melanotaenia boesemani]|uniref:epithelial cell adhesion molecule n=1 Tax=Melanotaenia boesemani TaxID=1250792 RepID=UPI001C05320F|nr:epithelial cell adhesion molecule [Melanotaenia boesemani]